VIVRHAASGEIVTRAGNRDPVAAPHGIYPCAGGEHIAIAVFDDEDWRSLVAVIGGPAGGQVDRFARVEARRAAQDELYRLVGAWTRTRSARELMVELQGAGVEAGLVQRGADLLSDPQLHHRGHFVPLAHRRLGTLQVEHAGIILSDQVRSLSAPGPDLGQHTDEVLSRALGLSADEIRGLRARGALA
jgi:benzylsuccinate CoA-transferase BbsF subunit